jgi:hypothetical protein
MLGKFRIDKKTGFWFPLGKRMFNLNLFGKVPIQPDDAPEPAKQPSPAPTAPKLTVKDHYTAEDFKLAAKILASKGGRPKGSTTKRKLIVTEAPPTAS